MDNLEYLKFESLVGKRRKEKMSANLKFPSYSEYPMGYDWFAYDSNGEGWFYAAKPMTTEGCFMMDIGDEKSPVVYEYSLVGKSIPDWKNTLRYNGEKVTQVSKPGYYTWHPVASCVKVSEQFNGNLAQAMQYIWRSETLNPKAITKGQSPEELIQDLRKAIRFIEFEIERIQNQ